MDGNHNPQQHPRGHASTSSPPAVSPSRSPSEPTVQPSASLRDHTPAHAYRPPANLPVPDQSPAPTGGVPLSNLSWSPELANSALSNGADNAHSSAPTELLPVQNQPHSDSQDQYQKDASSSTPTSSKRKHPSIAAERPIQSSNRQSTKDTLKRQRRTKAPKGASPIEDNAEPSGGAESMSSERPRLTEQEKKSNHIASEQKRRMAIREGFDRLTEMVPGLEGQGRSESIVLKKTVDHIREALRERQGLIERIQVLGGEIPPGLG